MELREREREENVFTLVEGQSPRNRKINCARRRVHTIRDNKDSVCSMYIQTL